MKITSLTAGILALAGAYRDDRAYKNDAYRYER